MDWAAFWAIVSQKHLVTLVCSQFFRLLQKMDARVTQRMLAWTRVTRDRCYDFLNILAEKFSEKIGVFLLKLLLVFAKIVIITLAFEKNANFFAEKLSKIAENCDHNIDP
jgi:hypothetical protein